MEIWDYDNIQQSYQEDYRKKAKQLRKAAKQGDAVAQTSLAVMYEKGLGVPKDLEEAVKWYRKAAEQGNSLAKFMLGSLYDDRRRAKAGKGIGAGTGRGCTG